MHFSFCKKEQRRQEKIHFLLLDQEKEKRKRSQVNHDSSAKDRSEKDKQCFSNKQKKLKILFKKFFSFCSDDLHNKPPYSK
jgi:hypothetical protein